MREIKNKKNLNLKKLLKKISIIKKNKKKIGLCHGVFDLLHPGHITYLNEAKSLCDYLVVSITKDEFVNKGPGRPFFDIEKRKTLVSNLSSVDYVVESNFETAEKIIKDIKPDLYVKGPDYKKIKNDLTNNINKEIKAIISVKGKFITTGGNIYSSSKFINSSFSIFSEKQKNLIDLVKKKHSFLDIKNFFNKLKKKKVLVVGETIVDQYSFCEALGKSGKESVLAFRKKKEINYAGGAVAVANNLSSFSNRVNLISYLGEKKEYLNFFLKQKPKNCKYNFIYKSNTPTIVKKRYIDEISNSKLIGIYEIKDNLVNKKETEKIKNYLNKELKNNEIVIVADYGHGLISKNIANTLCKKSKYISLNAQTNAANAGYHSINKYNSLNCLVINETELRYELRNKDEPIEKLIKELSKTKIAHFIIVTRGRNGSILLDKNKDKLYFCPAFETNPIDKIGAGDTLLYMFSIVFYISKCPILSLFLSSLAAANNVKFFANSEKMNDSNFLKLISHVLK